MLYRWVLDILAEAHDFESYRLTLEDARKVYQLYRESVGNGTVIIDDLVISKRLTRSPTEYKKANLTAIVAQQLYGSGVELRPGEIVQYIITDASNKLPNDRARAYSLWEGWHGYDRRKYVDLLKEAFKLFEYSRNNFQE